MVALLAVAGAAFALDCPQHLTRGQLESQLASAEAAYATMATDAFRDQMNELVGITLPCLGDLVPAPLAARTHRLMSVQQLELGNTPAAEASARAARQREPEVPFPESWLPADHPLRSAWQGAEPARDRRVPEPREGALAFDGVTSRDRPVGVPTVVQLFGADGVALQTRYLGDADPLPDYRAIPRRRTALALGAAGSGAAALATWTASWLQYRSILAQADDPTVTGADLDGQRTAVNLSYLTGGLLFGVSAGLGVGAVVVGPR